MQIRVFDHAEQVGNAAALIIAAQVIQKPDTVLGLPTGSTPIPVYQALVQLHKSGVLSFADTTTFNLDEYCGLPEEHTSSYHYFMNDLFFRHINIKKENYHLPNGKAEDLEEECKAYDEAIANAGGIDFQLLGIGLNGHIGFNEPSDQFVYCSHVVDLTPQTTQANRRFFAQNEKMPSQAISVGIGGIMKARQILLVATGADKAGIIQESLYGNITPNVQSSILRTHHHVVFLLDKEAAKKI